MSGRWKHPSPTMVVAVVALVLAMGGTSLAASHYIITSKKQIAPKVLKALKGNRGLTGAPGQQGAQGAQGAQGVKGADGATGATGARGPSDVYSAGDGSYSSSPPLSKAVPAGDYLVTGTVADYTGNGDSSCTLSGGTGSDQAYGSLETTGHNQETIVTQMVTHLAAPGTITLSCSGVGTFGYATLTALAAGAAH